MDHVGLSDPSSAPPSSDKSRHIAGVIGLAVLLLVAVIFPLLWWSGRTQQLWAFASFPPALFGMGYADTLASRARPGTQLRSGLFFRFAFGWLVLFPAIYSVAIGFAYLLALLIGLGFLLGDANAPTGGTDLYITLATCVTAVVVVLAECGKLIVSSFSAGNSNKSAPRPVWATSVYTALGLGTAESYYALLVLRVVWTEGTLPDSLANVGTSVVACTVMFTLMEVLASFHVSLGCLAAGRAGFRHAARLLLPAMLVRWLCIATVLILPAFLHWSAHSGLIAVGISVVESLGYLLWVKREERVLRRDSSWGNHSSNAHEPNVSSEGACSAEATSAA